MPLILPSYSNGIVVTRELPSGGEIDVHAVCRLINSVPPKEGGDGGVYHEGHEEILRGLRVLRGVLLPLKNCTGLLLCLSQLRCPLWLAATEACCNGGLQHHRFNEID